MSSYELPTEDVTSTIGQACWQQELSRAIRSPLELLNRLDLCEDRVPEVDFHQAAFRTFVPESFVNRMQPGNLNDPLLRQVLPVTAEQYVPDGFIDDAVNDCAARQAPGLLQKYAGRALLIATGVCAVHCRYCFRREYPYQDEPRQLDDWQPAIELLKSDVSISEIILSGGDPWMLNDDRLAKLCETLDSIEHIKRIRFHTRLPVVLPSRVTPQLLEILNSLRSKVVVVVHANHANEIVTDCREALETLSAFGLLLLNQSVLLKGINDSVEALSLLSTRLIDAGVLPYYLHQLDRVTGTSHFEVTDEDARKLIRQLECRLPGYAVPKLVREIPGDPSKTRL